VTVTTPRAPVAGARRTRASTTSTTIGRPSVGAGVTGEPVEDRSTGPPPGDHQAFPQQHFQRHSASPPHARQARGRHRTPRSAAAGDSPPPFSEESTFGPDLPARLWR
jgi:hypothetical protein